MLSGIGAITLPELSWVGSGSTLSELLRGWALLTSDYSKEGSPSEAYADVVARRSADDTAALEAVRSGNRDAFSILVRRYETKVRGYCARMLSSAADAEDAAQEVFIKAFRSLHRFRGDASFSSWLYRIAANHCIDLARKERISRWFRFGSLAETKVGAGSEDRSAAVSTEGALSVATRQLLEQVLMALPPAQRSLIILREAHGLSYEELAQTLQVSEESVRAHLKRARKKLFEIRAKIEDKIKREQDHG